MNKYCLPVIKNSKNAVLKELHQYKEYDFYEVWLDYIRDLDESFIKDLIAQYGEKLIFLLRRKQLETPQMTQKTQQRILSLAKYSSAYVDLDISQKHLLSFVKDDKLKMKLIGSYHNYEYTPESQVLKETVDAIQSYNPTIIKIATFCRAESDTVRLLQLLLSLKAENKKYIILGMNKFGTIARLAGALWGNEIIFAPKKKENISAPGQITKQEIETILNLLRTAD